MTEEVEELFMKIYNADAIMNEPVQKIDQAATISKPSLKTIFLGAFDKNSIVFRACSIWNNPYHCCHHRIFRRF